MAQPLQKPGRSKQDYGTPWAFIRAVEQKFGSLAWDLAARADNAKAPYFITPERDSLSADWDVLNGRLWLNPPFANIAPWARKAASYYRGRQLLMLTPASVGSDWFKEHVFDQARVFFLNGRITFDGTPPNPKTGKPDPYPKDCMLSVYGLTPGFEVWDWRVPVAALRAA